MKIAVLTLGCKVNKYESDALIFELKNRGFEATEKLEFADAYIINTCAVTNEAEKKSRQMIERARKFNPTAEIFVMGCASQNRPAQFEDKRVKFVIGTASKKKILDDLEKSGAHLYDLPKEYEDNLYSAQTLTRAFIKIQDGCDKFCSYCIIPYLRGRSRSRSVESIEDEVKKLPDFVKEIVLVGIDVADFKIDGKSGLGTLLQTLDKYGKRLRLSSMEDNLIDEEFLKQLSSLKNFCPHFHLSLQSGSDNVLKKMNRKYTTAEFENSVSPSDRPFRSPAACGKGTVACRAPALGSDPPGHGAREGQERIDDRAFRRRTKLTLLQERCLHGAAAPRDAATRSFRTEAAQ